MEDEQQPQITEAEESNQGQSTETGEVNQSENTEEEETSLQQNENIAEATSRQEPEVDLSKAHLTPTFFYDKDELFSKSNARSAFDEDYTLYHCFGFDLSRRYNAILLSFSIL